MLARRGRRIALAERAETGGSRPKRRHNGGELLDGNWPPLVDEGTYWSAVAVLRDPARRTNAGTRGGIRPGAARWLLSYIATCDECGAGLGVVTNRRRNGIPEPQYRCTHSQSTHCYAPVEWMDWLVGEAIVRWCAHPLVPIDHQRTGCLEVLIARRNGALSRYRGINDNSLCPWRNIMRGSRAEI